MRVVHRLSVEFRAVIRLTFPTRREAASISLAVVVVMVDVPVEMIPAVKPWSRSDEDAAVVPLWAVVSIRRALVRRSFIVAVRAIRLQPDIDTDLRRRLGRCCQQQTSRDCHS